MRLRVKELLLSLILLLPAVPALANGPIELSWDPNHESNIAGYLIYASRTPGDERLVGDVGLTATPEAPHITIPNAPDGPYYFRVAAYDTTGHVGPPSEEVNKTVPAPSQVTGLR